MMRLRNPGVEDIFIPVYNSFLPSLPTSLSFFNITFFQGLSVSPPYCNLIQNLQVGSLFPNAERDITWDLVENEDLQAPFVDILTSRFGVAPR